MVSTEVFFSIFGQEVQKPITLVYKVHHLKVHPLGITDGFDSSEVWFLCYQNTKHVKKDDLENNLIILCFES